MRSKTIYTTPTAFGGYTYRVSTDGQVAKIYESNRGKKERLLRTIALPEFAAWAESVDLYNPYDQNPAKISHYASN